MFSEAHDDQRLALGGGDRNDDYFVVDVIVAVEDEVVVVFVSVSVSVSVFLFVFVIFYFGSLSLAKTGDMVVLIVMINK